jgi:succinoglycan biosynthesis transport protein ExoP
MYFDWQDAWRIIKRWWWLFVIGAVLSGGPSYYLSKHKPAVYSARTRLMVGSSVLSADPNAQDLGLSLTLAQIYAEMVHMRPITQGVVNRLGVDLPWWELSARIQSRVIPSAQVLDITVTDSNPDFAATAANAVAEELVAQSSASLQGVDRGFIKQEVEGIQAKIAEAQAQIDEINDSLLNLTSAAELEEARSRLNELEQLRLAYHSTFVELVGLLNSQSPNSLTVIEPASPSYYPITPSAKKETLLAVMAGLALCTAAVFVLEFVDDTLRVQDTGAHAVLGLPLLGAVARMPNGRCDQWSPAAEMIRQLRTKVLLSSPDGRLKSLVVTSPMPKAGKTVLTANLGVAMAGGGARVVLIDADLRVPTMHEWLDQPNLAGLTELLSTDQAQWDQLLPQLLRDTNVPGLSFISAGRPPLDPAVLLISPRMSALLELLSQQFDFVLFDSSPALVAPDALILSTLAQGTLLVVSPGKTSRRAANRAKNKLLSRQDINLIGIALNRMPVMRQVYKSIYRDDAVAPQGSLLRLLNKLTGKLAYLPLIGRPKEIDLISLSQAASMLGVRHSTVKRWKREGRLPVVRKGLRWWVKQDEMQNALLDRLLEVGAEELSALEIQKTGDSSKNHTIRELPEHQVLVESFDQIQGAQ